MDRPSYRLNECSSFCEMEAGLFRLLLGLCRFALDPAQDEPGVVPMIRRSVSVGFAGTPKVWTSADV
jgi:hypothetical protein